MATVICAALVTNFLESLSLGLWNQNVAYFTNQSNLLFAFVLASGAAGARWTRSRLWDSLRGAAAFYLLMTGLIFALLIEPLSQLFAWNMTWQGAVLHRAAPLFAVADWLFVREKNRASGSRVVAWIAYPLAYLVGTWIRGEADGFYPYDFMNPLLRGWGPVAATTAIVFVVFFGVAALVHHVGKTRALDPWEGHTATNANMKEAPRQPLG